MTPEQINRAIAEYYGWKDLEYRGIWKPRDCDTQWLSGIPPKGEVSKYNLKHLGNGHYVVTNYYADLNAMHEAEKTLSSTHSEEYIHQLMGVCRGQATKAYGVAVIDPFTSLWLGVFATAPQRAEAFVKTINKWIE